MNDSCFICQKHAGLTTQPPGGYLYEEANWRICHAPAQIAKAGTVFVESKRHFLDFAEMREPEAESYGLLMQKAYRVLKQATGAERIYTVIMLEGVAHFHAWLVPRLAGDEQRGMNLLAENHLCEEQEAVKMAERLRRAFQDSEE